MTLDIPKNRTPSPAALAAWGIYQNCLGLYYIVRWLLVLPVVLWIANVALLARDISGPRQATPAETSR